MLTSLPSPCMGRRAENARATVRSDDLPFPTSAWISAKVMVNVCPSSAIFRLKPLSPSPVHSDPNLAPLMLILHFLATRLVVCDNQIRATKMKARFDVIPPLPHPMQPRHLNER